MNKWNDKAESIGKDVLYGTHFLNRITIALSQSYDEGVYDGTKAAISLIEEFAPDDAKWVQLLIDRLNSNIGH